MKCLLIFSVILFSFEWSYAQSIEVDGSIKIGFDHSQNIDEGVMRYVNGRFEGFNGEMWQSLNKSKYILGCPDPMNDLTSPQAIITPQLLLSLSNTGSTQINASDFDINSYDNCGQKPFIGFQTENGNNNSSFLLDCVNIPNGISAYVELIVIVIDNSGNFTTLPVYVILRDVFDVCPDVSGGAISSQIVGDN